jgi:hypothetical protein
LCGVGEAAILQGASERRDRPSHLSEVLGAATKGLQSSSPDGVSS